MAEHPNAVLARRGHDAFISGDLDTVRELMAQDVTWHQPHTGLIGGDYVGKDRVFEFFGKLIELSGGTYKTETVDVLADDDRAVVIQHSTARRNGKTIDTRQVLVEEIRDGKVTDIRLYPSEEEDEQAFWS